MSNIFESWRAKKEPSPEPEQPLRPEYTPQYWKEQLATIELLQERITELNALVDRNDPHSFLIPIPNTNKVLYSNRIEKSVSEPAHAEVSLFDLLTGEKKLIDVSRASKVNYLPYLDGKQVQVWEYYPLGKGIGLVGATLEISDLNLTNTERVQRLSLSDKFIKSESDQPSVPGLDPYQLTLNTGAQTYQLTVYNLEKLEDILPEIQLSQTRLQSIDDGEIAFSIPHTSIDISVNKKGEPIALKHKDKDRPSHRTTDYVEGPIHHESYICIQGQWLEVNSRRDHIDFIPYNEVLKWLPEGEERTAIESKREIADTNEKLIRLFKNLRITDNRQKTLKNFLSNLNISYYSRFPSSKALIQFIKEEITNNEVLLRPAAAPDSQNLLRATTGHSTVSNGDELLRPSSGPEDPLLGQNQ